VVPNVIGKLLPTARTKIRRAHCRVGSIHYVRSSKAKRNRVLGEKPRAGRKLRNGAKLNLTVGRGSR
jgi:beta-lactam-binding protein with PASTA domain